MKRLSIELYLCVSIEKNWFVASTKSIIIQSDNRVHADLYQLRFFLQIILIFKVIRFPRIYWYRSVFFTVNLYCFNDFQGRLRYGLILVLTELFE